MVSPSLEHRRELEAWQQRLAARMPGVFFQVPEPNRPEPLEPQHRMPARTGGSGAFALHLEHLRELRRFDAALRSR